MTADPRIKSLEICVDSPAGVAAAIAGGADRIEVCAALAIGGLTPSAGLTETARAATRAAGIAVFAMVRPRDGDFSYDETDVTLAIAEARALVAQGVDGLVFGAVRGRQIDADASRRWIDAVRQAAGTRLPCTFHRAIDIVADPVAAVETVAALGFDRILTSGGALRAPDGAATIRAMVARSRLAGDTISIMAGSGVTPDTAAALLASTGVRELHASASIATDTTDTMLTRFGFAPPTTRHTDARIVRGLRSALDDAASIQHWI